MQRVLRKVVRLPYRRFKEERAVLVNDRFYYDKQSFELKKPFSRFRDEVELVEYRHRLRNLPKVFQFKYRKKTVWWDSTPRAIKVHRWRLLKHDKFSPNGAWRW